MQLLLYFGIFWGGLFVGYMLHHWLISMKSYDGTMRVILEEEKTVYSLELAEDPIELAHRPLVIFKVETVDSDRE